MIRLSAIFLVLFSANVFARPVTITYEGVASGSLDGTAFTNVAFTIVGNADTADLSVVTNVCGSVLVHHSTKVALEGLGEFRFLTDGAADYASIRNASGDTLQFVQFIQGSAIDLVTLQKSPCVDGDLLSYPAVTSPMIISTRWVDNPDTDPVMTEGGRLIFNADAGNSEGSRTLTHPPAPPAQPVPAMPIYPLVVLAGLLALLGFSRVRVSK